MTFSNGISLDEIESFDRNVELCVISVEEQHELASACSQIKGLQPTKFSNAVIDVNDKVVGTQVPKVRKKRSRLRPPLLPVFLPPAFGSCYLPFVSVCRFIEDVRFNVDYQTRLWQRKPTAQTAHRDNCRDSADRIRRFCDQRQPRFDLILSKNLSNPFSNTQTRQHKQRRSSVVSRTSNTSSQVSHPSVVTHRRLGLPFKL